ncbi:MAG: ABC transporter permease [Halanaerobiaceae bacterium]|nr:ABC transporter permease [Halanaerobiaceae bacterium]
MDYLIKIAFKNLFRSKLRTFVSIIAIAFGVMIVVFSRGLVEGMIDTITADHIQYNSGHIKIVDREYWKKERLLTLYHPVDGFAEKGLDEMITGLAVIDGVEGVVPRIKFAAMVSTEEELVTMSGWGVDPALESTFTDIEGLLEEGRMVQPGRREAVMGTSLLEKINARVGDKITILFNTAFGSLKGVTFTITGRLESDLKLLNEAVFYLPLDQARIFLEMEGQATELLLFLSDREKVATVLPVVREFLDREEGGEHYLALSYRETSDLIPLMDLSEMIFNFIYIFLVLLSCVVVINTMIMIVRERTKEIGMMSALGLEKKEILLLFLIEGAFMGIVGSFAGALAGYGVNAYLGKVGFDYAQALSGMDTDILFSTMIYPEASISNTIFSFFLGIIIVTAACIFPARRAVKLEPVEAMRD